MISFGFRDKPSMVYFLAKDRKTSTIMKIKIVKLLQKEKTEFDPDRLQHYQNKKGPPRRGPFLYFSKVILEVVSYAKPNSIQRRISSY